MAVTQNSILRISDEKTLQLIELYEKEECLWNTSLTSYKVREKRLRAAQRIADKLNVSNFEAKHVMIKFKNLRNSYCQELKKIANSLSSGVGEDEVYRPKVFWFHKMDSFLRPHLQPPRSTTTLQFLNEDSEASNSNKEHLKVEIKSEVEDFEETEEWVQMSNPQEVLQDGSFQPSTDDETSLRPRRRAKSSRQHSKRPKIDVTEHSCSENSTSLQMLKAMCTNLEVLTNQRNDPFDSFGKYIASMLRSMPAQKAMQVQPKIVGLVTSAAMGGCEGRVSQSDENV